MTIQTFHIAIPIYNTRIDPKPNQIVVKFGDGFEQRLTYGINQNPKQFMLTWNNITEENADIIESFLDSRAFDNQSFDFTHQKKHYQNLERM